MDSEDPMEPMLTPRVESVMRTGCACRSELALAHVGCLARAAEESKQDAVWWSCRTCKKVFTGQMRGKLALEFLPRTEPGARWSVAEMNVATAARLEGRYADAAKMHRVLYDRAVAERGAESSLAIKILTELVADASGLGVGAAELGAQLLDVCERALGSKHASTVRARSDLAVRRCREGRGAYAELEQTLRNSIDDAAAHDHGLLMRAKCNLCVVLRAMRRHNEAYEQESEVLAELTRVFGRDHPNTIKSKYEVACDLINAGLHEQAESVLRELEDDSARVFGATTNNTTRLISSKRAGCSALVLRNTKIKKENAVRKYIKRKVTVKHLTPSRNLPMAVCQCFRPRPAGPPGGPAHTVRGRGGCHDGFIATAAYPIWLYRSRRGRLHCAIIRCRGSKHAPSAPSLSLGTRTGPGPAKPGSCQ
jgi:hypothetical protein